MIRLMVVMYVRFSRSTRDVGEGPCRLSKAVTNDGAARPQAETK
jgi:hypothetical protein